MKKICMSLLLLLTYSMSNAQYMSNLKMNYNGLFTTQDGKNYDVVIMDGKSAAELFDMVRENLALKYNSPKEVESNVDDKIISIYGYAQNCTFFTAPGMKFYLSFHYTLKFQFKDGKIKIYLPYLTTMQGSAWENLEKTFRAKGIFSRDGVLSKKENKRQTVIMLENYFNNIINCLINGIRGSDEDW